VTRNNPWDQVPVVTEGEVAGWIELGESGWDALIGWVAGPDRLRRVHDDINRYTVQVSCESAEGGITRWTEPRTAEDHAGIDADINSYLADAGASPRPSGFRWFLLPPPNLAEHELTAAFIDGVDRLATKATLPADMVEPFRRIVAEIYGN
jgi:uncharacterized protein DUF5956